MTPKPMYADERTAAFRATLDRLPDEIALAIGLLAEPTCFVEWVVREAIARRLARPGELEAAACPACVAANRFGEGVKGDPYQEEWHRIYYLSAHPENGPLIEEALFDRVMAAATSKKRRSA